MKKLLKSILSTALIGSLLIGCSGETTSTATDTSTTAAETSTDNTTTTQTNDGELQTVSVVGSTTVQPVAQDAADAFMAENPNISIEIQGVGSSAGVQAAYDGTADIGAASRELKGDELDWGLDQHIIAHDAIAVVLHKDNPVENLTLDQVKQIFVGEISNWSEVGGPDEDIIVISREEGSGTRSAFQEIVGFEEPSELALINDGNGAVKANLATQPYGIGYISLGIVDDTIKAVSVNDIAPTLETTKSGEYPISRNLLMLTKGELDDGTQSYLDFILSDAGQEIVAEHYIPVN